MLTRLQKSFNPLFYHKRVIWLFQTKCFLQKQFKEYKYSSRMKSFWIEGSLHIINRHKQVNELVVFLDKYDVSLVGNTTTDFQRIGNLNQSEFYDMVENSTSNCWMLNLGNKFKLWWLPPFYNKRRCLGTL